MSTTPQTLVDLQDLIFNLTLDAGIELMKRLEPVFKDAERYRWLRHGDNDDICIEFAEGVDCYADGVWLLRGEKLDAMIDAGIEHDAKAAEHVAVGPGLGAA